MDTGIREKEYLMLREEVQNCLKEQRNLSTFSVTAVITIIGFTIQMDEPIPDLFLLPYIVLLIAAIKVGNYRQSMVRIVAYMIERHETSDGFQWESCLNSYRLRTKLDKHGCKMARKEKSSGEIEGKYKRQFGEKLSRFLETQEYALMAVICLALFIIYSFPQLKAGINQVHSYMILGELIASIGVTFLLILISKDYWNLEPDLIEKQKNIWHQILIDEKTKASSNNQKA